MMIRRYVTMPLYYCATTVQTLRVTGHAWDGRIFTVTSKSSTVVLCVTSVLATRKSSRTNMNSLQPLNCVDTKSMETMLLDQTIRVVSEVIRNVDSATSASIPGMNCGSTVATSTNVVTYVNGIAAQMFRPNTT